MTTPKRLSPGALDAALDVVEFGYRPRCAEAKAVIRSRIAALETELDLARKGFDPGSPAEITIKALERHISDLEQSLENARKKRDEAVADNAALLALLRDAVMGMNHACDTLNDMDAVDEAKDGPAMAAVGRVTVAMESIEASVHPGVALLEEHRKEIARWQENVETVKGERDTERRMRLEQGEALAACQQHVRETGEDHRKALVRARNEGLEKAAEHGDFATTYAEKKARRSTMTDVERASWTLAARLARDMAAAIRAMKEPEPT